MKDLAKKVARTHLEKLPGDAPYYAPEDLPVYDIPNFLVERVVIELRDHLAQEVHLQDTEWADLQAEPVQRGWQHFFDIAASHLRLPAGQAEPVFQTAVEELLGVMIEPRKRLAELLFGDHETCSYDALSRVAMRIVIYPRLARAIPRYMERRGLDEMTRGRASELLARVDDKMNEGNTALNWVQWMDPWFILLGNNIDAKLLQRFFEDKQMNRLAESFKQQKGSLGRGNIMEMLEQALEQSGKSGEESVESGKRTGSGDSDTGSDGSGEPSKAQPEGRDEASQAASAGGKKSSGEESGVSGVSGDAAASGEESPRFYELLSPGEEDDSGETLISRYTEQEEESRAQQQSPGKGKETGSKAAKAAGQPGATGSRKVADEGTVSGKQTGKKSGTGQQSKAAGSDEAGEGQQSGVPEERQEQQEQEEEIPFWKQFAGQGAEDEDDDEQQPFLYDATGQDEASGDRSEHLKMLLRHVEDKKDHFTDELFAGDENSFFDAMEEIAAHSSWSDAARYITSEIFRRNHVDIYSDIAVEFTDRLQSYFMEREQKSSND